MNLQTILIQQLVSALVMMMSPEVRIPEETGHRFHVKVDTDSTANWTPIPGQTGH